MQGQAEDGSALQVVQQFVGCFVRGDIGGALQLLDNDVVVYECDSVPYPGDHRGKSAFVALAKQVHDVWDFKGRPSVRFFGAPDGAVALIRNAAVARATGRRLELKFAEVYTVRDGCISAIEMYYWDTVAMAAANEPDA